MDPFLRSILTVATISFWGWAILSNHSDTPAATEQTSHTEATAPVQTQAAAATDSASANKTDTATGNTQLAAESQTPVASTKSAETPDPDAAAKRAKLEEKLIAKYKRHYPNDASMQEILVKANLEAYDYMLTVPDKALKARVQADNPMEFTSQMTQYNAEIDRREAAEIGQ